MINCKIYPINNQDNNIKFEELRQIIIPHNEVFIYNNIFNERNYYSILYNKIIIYITNPIIKFFIFLILLSSIIVIISRFFIDFY
jgi:hypothetical protein